MRDMARAALPALPLHANLERNRRSPKSRFCVCVVLRWWGSDAHTCSERIFRVFTPGRDARRRGRRILVCAEVFVVGSFFCGSHGATTRYAVCLPLHPLLRHAMAAT